MFDCVSDLARHGMLVTIDEEIDANQEAAAIARRVYRARGPALLFRRVRGSGFPLLGNLFGTVERARFIFRDTLRAVSAMVAMRTNPQALLRRPLDLARLVPALWHTLPASVAPRCAPVLRNRIRASELPAVVGWPQDGGAFITLPQVYTEDPEHPGWMHSNLGMYRIQLNGGSYTPDHDLGLHYQLHRGIGCHHASALRRGERLRVNVFVGGPPAMTLAAVMPLPEGVPEIVFGGALGGRRMRLTRLPDNRREDSRRADNDRSGTAAPPGPSSPLPILADADFCIVGSINPHRKLPEGPFGDHLGYYSLAHDFPVFEVEAVYHRPDAIWPFTTVGRPPQEDTTFGDLIHEMTGPAIPAVLPGIHAVHAVDAAGVHPLLLAIGSERYTPYETLRVPQELLTQANALLGQGQLSLAKYLMIVAREDDPALDIHDIPAFFSHLLARLDPRRDLHFQTCTTIDTLDYSSGTLNQGSKVVLAAVGRPRRVLGPSVPADLRLPADVRNVRTCMPGVLALEAPAPRSGDVAAICSAIGELPEHPLLVVVDDADFVARSIDNFLWTTFTRSNPASDLHGVGAFFHDKHWGCSGPLVIDARAKPHHAPALEEDPTVCRRIEELAARGRPLHGLF